MDRARAPSSFPRYEVSPRIALSAVVLPAPFGPMSPRMRPSSTRRSTLSSATVVPKALRRPRASIVAIASSASPFILPRSACGGGIEFFLRQTKPLNLFRDPRPFFGKKFLAFALQQQIARAGFNEHAEPSLHLDQLFIDHLLISLENGERIDPIFGRDIAHRRQRIAFFEHAVENHMDATIAKLAINRLTIVPFTIHPVFQTTFPNCWLACCLSCSVIVDYNTIALASLFLRKIFAAARFWSQLLAESLIFYPSAPTRKRQSSRCPLSLSSLRPAAFSKPRDTSRDQEPVFRWHRSW